MYPQIAFVIVVVQSHLEGIRKPEPEIYARCCARLGLAPAECAFVDDLGQNLKPARAMGMLTIKAETADRSGARLVSELGRALGVALDVDQSRL